MTNSRLNPKKLATREHKFENMINRVAWIRDDPRRLFKWRVHMTFPGSQKVQV
jgi:hypothetical protein